MSAAGTTAALARRSSSQTPTSAAAEHGDETNAAERVLYERRLPGRRAEDGDQHRTNEHERRQDKPNYARVAD